MIKLQDLWPANDNAPLRFGEWLTRRVGGRWYTAKRPARIMMQDRTFLSPKAYAALEDEFRRSTGRQPYDPITCSCGGDSSLQ